MSEQARVVAVLVSGPALSSILSMVLASVPTLRVRPFETVAALATYMRLAPVDLVVSDFDSRSAPADGVAQALHGDATLAGRDFQIIALASQVTSEMKAASITAGIDEIIIKPMSPRYLLERVLSRLQHRSRPPKGRWSAPDATRQAPLSGSNVIPLFGHRLETQP
jgi:response regulator RpfG family c-di-GMP phosphodiesterase